MYHFFVTPEHIADQEVRITGADVNHMKNVLRMRPKEELLISDGEGSDYRCLLREITEGEAICSILEKTENGTEPSVRICLFQALPKADKMEHIIQKAVELGVYEIIPTETSRCVVKYDAGKRKTKAARWQKIAEAAAKQSHRGLIPEVRPVMTFEQALRYAGGNDDCGSREKPVRSAEKENSDQKPDLLLIPYENYKDLRATKELFKTIRPGMKVGIFIGPEGGFAEDEVALAMKAGASPVSLGNRILRTETAPLMLLSVLTFLCE